MNFMSTATTNDVTEVIARPVMRAEALALAREGFAVLPLYEIGADGSCACGKPACSSPGKHPRLKHGLKEATKEIETIRQWWSQWPDANIGIATGAVSGVFVLDIDIKNNGHTELARLLEANGAIPDTRICQTGGGGFHTYFQLAPDQHISNSASKIAQGIDVRGDGGYVVAPPSNHASGRHYEWNNPECLIKEAPKWLLGLCHAPTPKVVASKNTSQQAPEFLSAGRRNTDFTSLAGTLRSKGWDGARIEAALAVVNATLVEALPPDELTSIAQGMERYAPRIKLDELFISDLIVNAFRALVRHSTALGWMFYDGCVWRPDDGDKFVTQLAKRTLEQLADFAETLEVDGVAIFPEKEIRKIKRRSVLANTLNISASDARVTASHLDFDSAANLLCLENGTLDLRTQTLREHRHGDMLTHMMPISYDPAATCPIFDKFLTDTLPPDDIGFVMRVLAYGLTGTGNEQKFVIFHGVGRNGKSTLVNVVGKLFGDYAVTAEPTSFLRKTDGGASNDIARLAAARIVLTSELPNGAILDAPLVKRLTGQDPITARYLYKEHFEFQPRFLLLMVTNYLPVIEGSDSAIARRVLAVPFRNIVPLDQVDQGLDQKLWQERAGIFNRLLEALKSYQEQGLAPSQNVVTKTKDFLDDTNLIKRFIETCCEVSPEAKAPVSALHQRFWSMCISEGIKPMSQRSFGQQLEQAQGLTTRRVSRGMEWVGIKLRSGP